MSPGGIRWCQGLVRSHVRPLCHVEVTDRVPCGGEWKVTSAHPSSEGPSRWRSLLDDVKLARRGLLSPAMATAQWLFHPSRLRKRVDEQVPFVGAETHLPLVERRTGKLLGRSV